MRAVMPSFAVLFHETPPGSTRASHWDFMAESGSALRTWALDREPSPGVVIGADPLPDHRLAYLTYEGPISGDRGQVRRWDAGQLHWILDSPESVVLAVSGQRLCGEVRLKRSSESRGRWEFLFCPSDNRSAEA